MLTYLHLSKKQSLSRICQTHRTQSIRSSKLKSTSRSNRSSKMQFHQTFQGKCTPINSLTIHPVRLLIVCPQKVKTQNPQKLERKKRAWITVSLQWKCASRALMAMHKLCSTSVMWPRKYETRSCTSNPMNSGSGKCKQKATEPLWVTNYELPYSRASMWFPKYWWSLSATSPSKSANSMVNYRRWWARSYFLSLLSKIC